MSKRRVEIELDFYGDGRVKETRPHSFSGGVKPPRVTEHFGFEMTREDAHGEPQTSVEGAIQLNVWGTAADFRELGRYFVALAELDATVDPDYHEHHDALQTDSRNAVVNVIVRKSSRQLPNAR